MTSNEIFSGPHSPEVADETTSFGEFNFASPARLHVSRHKGYERGYTDAAKSGVYPEVSAASASPPAPAGRRVSASITMRSIPAQSGDIYDLGDQYPAPNLVPLSAQPFVGHSDQNHADPESSFDLNLDANPLEDEAEFGSPGPTGPPMGFNSPGHALEYSDDESFYDDANQSPRRAISPQKQAPSQKQEPPALPAQQSLSNDLFHRRTGSNYGQTLTPQASESPRYSPHISGDDNSYRQTRPASADSSLSGSRSGRSSSVPPFQHPLMQVNSGPDVDALMPRFQTIELYRKNAQKSNDPVIQYRFAEYMLQTALMPSDEQTDPEEKDMKGELLKEAVTYLKRLAEKGNADAQYLLGDVYSSGAVQGRPNQHQAFHYFLMGAKHNHAEASYRVALCLQHGWGTSRDAARALRFYKTAAAKNQPGALYQLGMAYFHGGLGISDNATNRQTGIKFLSHAVPLADKVYNRAPYELAKIYEAGYKDIIFKDLAYAVKLYMHSADLGFVPAAYKLGATYEYGLLECPQDADLSIHYYTIGALGNDPKSQLAMCAWYMQGAGKMFPPNEDEAYEWALRAAHNGLPKAQYTVAILLAKGTGCERDIFASTQWLKKAANNGYEPAKKRLRENETDLSKKECTIM